MFEKDKEKKIFHFFYNKKKKDPVALTAGRVTLKAFGNVFKFFSYILGFFFFMGIAMSVGRYFDSEGRLQKQQAYQNRVENMKFINAQTLSKLNIDLIDIIKSQKEPSIEKTIELINQKYKNQINFKFADSNTLMLTRNIGYHKFEYVLSLNSRSIRLLDISPETLKEFERLAKDRTDISWHQNQNNFLDKNINNRYLDISIKN